MKRANHEYSVELRLFGSELDPDAVTRTTGLNPSQVRRVGEQRFGRTAQRGMWAFNGDHDAYWETLEAGLLFMLDRVEQRSSVFQSLSKGNQLIWWCGHFQSSFDGGPSLSVGLLNRLATFGAELFIDNYFSDSSE